MNAEKNVPLKKGTDGAIIKILWEHNVDRRTGGGLPDSRREAASLAKKYNKNRAVRPEGVTEVRIYMLGEFRIQIDDAVLRQDASRSLNIWSLLSYLIINRHRPVPQEELIDLLWPDESIADPASALKTLLFRTRAVLIGAFGKDISFVLSQRGACSWNRELPCWVDAEAFEALADRAMDETLPAADRLSLRKDATGLYRGEFMSKLAGKLWVMPLASRYHDRYVAVVLAQGQQLLDNDDYGMCTSLLWDAIRREPYDERLHCMLVKALLRQGKTMAALDQYRTAAGQLYNSLGVEPGRELRALYREILQEQRAMEADLSTIQKDLREDEMRQGPFVCEYGFFREAYRLQARRSMREGLCVHIGLLTLSLRDGTQPELPQLNDAMAQLLDSLRHSLRRGDVVSRYSVAQYVVMLPGANLADSKRIMERIARAFEGAYRRKNMRLTYELRQMELEPDPVPER